MTVKERISCRMEGSFQVEVVESLVTSRRADRRRQGAILLEELLFVGNRSPEERRALERCHNLYLWEEHQYRELRDKMSRQLMRSSRMVSCLQSQQPS